MLLVRQSNKGINAKRSRGKAPRLKLGLPGPLILPEALLKEFQLLLQAGSHPGGRGRGRGRSAGSAGRAPGPLRGGRVPLPPAPGSPGGAARTARAQLLLPRRRGRLPPRLRPEPDQRPVHGARGQLLCARSHAARSSLESSSELFTVCVNDVLYLLVGQYPSVFLDNASGSTLTVRSGSHFSAILLGV